MGKEQPESPALDAGPLCIRTLPEADLVCFARRPGSPGSMKFRQLTSDRAKLSCGNAQSISARTTVPCIGTGLLLVVALTWLLRENWLAAPKNAVAVNRMRLMLHLAELGDPL